MHRLASTGAREVREYGAADGHTVALGSLFTGVTHSGRVITLGKVVEFEPARPDFPYPYRVCWYDERGKHYEWFNLTEPRREFREFQFIHQKEVVQ